jgi:hypothetical protein
MFPPEQVNKSGYKKFFVLGFSVRDFGSFHLRSKFSFDSRD